MSVNRRGWLAGAGAALSSVWLGACDRLNASPGVTKTLQAAEELSRRAHRLVADRRALAKEFGPEHISTDFRANGSIDPQNAEYLALKAGGFADWRLVIDGLVEQPMTLTLAQLRAQPARTQITRHDCVEGWSSIGKWTGARLEPLLDQVRLKPEAKFLVFHCADSLAVGGDKYYESIDLIDARHPQTILAYEMNDQPLPVKHGAPVRLRVERQLGYKHAKYVMRIEAVDSLERFGQGRGGYWEDRGYEWYAGI
jgi:DMSO/TMAO reductase YedYZ molybdopterin-dependent catalytic subunit